MKLAEINIGLTSKTLGEISEEQAFIPLTAYGFEIIAYRIAESVAAGEKELCLAVKVVLPERWQEKLSEVAEILGQDCIAVVGFIGCAPYDTFIRKHWRTSDEKQHVIELSEKTVYHWEHSDLVGICKWEAAKIRKARFDKQVGGGKFN